MEANWIQQIDAYLRNELSTEARLAFEANLKTDADLRAELELQQLVYEGIKRMGQRKLVQQSGKIYRFRKQLKWVVASVIIASAIASAVYLIAANKGNTEGPEMREMDGAQLKQMEKNMVFDNIIPEYFEYTGEKAIFLSESGVLLSVAEGCFLLNGKPYSGEALIQWQEAQSAADIVKAGLSTVSGTQLLETRGMFSLQAFTPDGKKLTVSEKGIYVQVPVEELKEGMMLFTGIPDKNGNLDWQNPEPLEKLPVLADMKDLNFYPPGYEKKLHQLNWDKAKKQKDSLYLSFERSPIPSEIFADTLAIIYDNTSSSESSNTDSLQVTNWMFRMSKLNDREALVTATVTIDDPWKIGMSTLSQTNQGYSTIFGLTPSPNFNLIGQVSELITSESFFNYIGEVAIPVSQVEFTQKISLNSPKPFIVEGYYSYQACIGKSNCQTTHQGTFSIDTIGYQNQGSDLEDMNDHIPPSKVLAIWQPKFNNTNLSTRDFEKRMQAVHGTCQQNVFEIYTKQLTKPIWQLDEQVAKMGYPEFRKFAAERVGKVDVTDEHQQNLKQFYEESIRQLKEQAKSDKDFQRKLDAAWDKDVSIQRTDESSRTARRVSQSLNEEYQFNLSNVGKQLGKTLGFQIHGGGTVVNIDKYVWDATVARKSTIITDPETGKTAKITYNECTATVLDATKYSKLFMYTFPDKINSFERIDAKKGKFSYNLNGDMNYNLAFIGINEKGYFYAERKNLNGGKLGKFTLDPISEKEFNQKISALNASRNTTPMSLSDELSWLVTEQKDVVVQNKRKDMEEFRYTLRVIVYPCLKNQTETYGPM